MARLSQLLSLGKNTSLKEPGYLILLSLSLFRKLKIKKFIKTLVGASFCMNVMSCFYLT